MIPISSSTPFADLKVDCKIHMLHYSHSGYGEHHALTKPEPLSLFTELSDIIMTTWDRTLAHPGLYQVRFNN